MTPFQLKPRVKNNSRTRKHIYEHIRVATPLRTGMHPYTNTHIHTVGSGRRRHQKGVMARGGPVSVFVHVARVKPHNIYTQTKTYIAMVIIKRTATQTRMRAHRRVQPHIQRYTPTHRSANIYSQTPRNWQKLQLTI